jgi:hypothetical protein
MFAITMEVRRLLFGDDMDNDVAEFERKLGVKPNFYRDLLENDDWSFVIKLNALFEAACTHVISIRLGTPELLDTLAHLEFADQKKGKVKFLLALDAISSEQAKILYALAKLRNDLVHDVSQVSFSMNEYIAGLDANQLKSQCKLWGHGLHDSIDLDGKKVSRQQYVQARPKQAIWATCMEILACLHVEFEYAEYRAARQFIRGNDELADAIASGSAVGVRMQGLPKASG